MKPNLPEAISLRHSTRSFSEGPASTADLATISDCISGHESHLGLVAGGDLKRMATYGVIKGQPAYITVHCDGSRADTIQAAFEAEDAVLKVTAAGLGSCWLAGTFSRGSFPSDALPDGHNVVAVIAVGRHADKTSLIDRMMRRVAGSSSRKRADKLFFEGTPDAPAACLDNGTAIDPALEAVRLAPSASNRQPWRVVAGSDGHYHLYIAADNRYSLLDAGIALRHLTAVTGREPAAMTPPAAPRDWHYIASV